MAVVNIHEAKTHLSNLLARVEAGETVVIARRNKPIAKLMPTDEPRHQEPRRMGTAKNLITLHPACFDPPGDSS